MYRKRLVERIISEQLKNIGGLMIVGPKWCGKTETSKQFANTIFKLDDATNNFANRQLAEIDPSKAVVGTPPILIDEWQVVPKLFDAARFMIDKQSAQGMYILTGSSTNQEATIHSGTGRFTTINMSTLSLQESGDSDGSIKLDDLFNGSHITFKMSKMTLDRLIKLIIKGGWPIFLKNNKISYEKNNASYIKNLIENDSIRISKLMINKRKLIATIKSLSRNVATSVNFSTLSRDIKQSDREKVSDETVLAHYQMLQNLYIVLDIPAWAPSIRSSIRIRQTPKRIFVDPSLAVASLELTAEMLIKDLRYLGFLFENFVLRDLLIYASIIGANIHYYSDNSGLEIDVIITKRDKWGAVEIKLGDNQVKEACDKLRALKNKMTTAGNDRPTFLMVITGVNSASRMTDDGIYIVPIDQLGV